MKKTSALLACLTILFLASAQTKPSINWQKCLGGDSYDVASAITPQSAINNNGYIVAGLTASANLPGHHGNSADYYVAKLDTAGNVIWQKCYGGSADDRAKAVAITSDGDYVVVGMSASNDGDVTGHHGNIYTTDYWVIKLDTVGNIKWQKSFGGSEEDEANAVIVTRDGNILVAGSTASVNGDVSNNNGGTDGWLIKLDNSGNILWQKSIGANFADIINQVVELPSGGYAFTGFSNSNSGPLADHHGETTDLDGWVGVLDMTGNAKWQKSIGGTYEDAGNNIQLLGKDIYVAGYSFSNDGDISGHHGTNNADYMLVKLDTSGHLIWEKSFGGTDDDRATGLAFYPAGQTSSASPLMLAGYSMSANGDVAGAKGMHDFWLLATDTAAASTIAWQQNYGGPNDDYCWNILFPAPGSAFLVGATRSNSGDVSGNHTGNNDIVDAWVVKLKETEVLPITLTGFNGVLKGQNVVMYWQAVTDINTNYFDVERSNGNDAFKTVQTVKSVNNSTVNSYQAQDDVSGLINNTKTVYYRLKIVNKDGKASYSNIVTVSLTKNTTLKAWPNPANSVLRVATGNYAGKLKVTVFDVQGKKVADYYCNAANGVASLNISNISAGAYMLYTVINGATINQKFIKD